MCPKALVQLPRYDQYPTIEVPIDQIDVESFPNVRTRFDRLQFEALVANIRERKRILEDPIVRRKSDETLLLQDRGKRPGSSEKAYEVIAGYQRTKAAVILHKETRGNHFSVLLVKLANVPDDEARWIQLSENLARSPLVFSDQTDAILKFEREGRDAQYIADRLGVSRAWVAQRLSFRHSAHHELIAAVDRKVLAFSAAYKLMLEVKGDLGAQQRAAQAATFASVQYVSSTPAGLLSERIKTETASRAARIEVALRTTRQNGKSSYANSATQPRVNTQAVYGHLTSASRQQIVQRLARTARPRLPEGKKWTEAQKPAFDAGVYYALSAQSSPEKTLALLERYGVT